MKSQVSKIAVQITIVFLSLVLCSYVTIVANFDSWANVVWMFFLPVLVAIAFNKTKGMQLAMSGVLMIFGFIAFGIVVNFTGY
jgi:apolipoprotein N-acyltransferase